MQLKWLLKGRLPSVAIVTNSGWQTMHRPKKNKQSKTGMRKKSGPKSPGPYHAKTQQTHQANAIATENWRIVLSAPKELQMELPRIQNCPFVLCDNWRQKSRGATLKSGTWELEGNADDIVIQCGYQWAHNTHMHKCDTAYER
eukprot:2215620-Amphidinium_carterae.1